MSETEQDGDSQPSRGGPASGAESRTKDEPGANAPTRVCPHCSTISETNGNFCPQCGKPLTRKSRKPLAIVVVVLVILAIGGGVAAYFINHHSEEQANKRKRDAALKLRRQTEHEKTEALAREHEQTVRERKSAETELEQSIEKYARKLVSEGTLEEAVTGASCNSVSGGSSSNLGVASGTYSCIAITRHEPDGSVYGYHFSGTIDFADGKYSYRLGGGE